MFILYLLIFTTCVNSSDDNIDNNTETGTGTFLEFRNLEDFSVTVYTDSMRQTVFAEIGAKETKKVPAVPNITGIVFYPTFKIVVPLVQEITIPYNGQGIVTVIEENKTTPIPIPKLESIEINTAYIKLVNDSNYSLSLREGIYEKTPLGNRPNIITPGQSAAYEINPGPSSGYSVMRNITTRVDFSANLTEFKHGMVYAITYDGTNLVLKATWPIPSSSWPVAPKNVHTEQISTTSVRLAWDAVYDAESYRIYRSVGSNASYSQITVTTATSYTDNSLTSNLIYFYKVSAIKDSKEGNRSDEVSGRIIPSPGNFRVVGSGDNFILLAWNNVNTATNYNIYRSETINGNYLKVGTEWPVSIPGVSINYSTFWGDGTGLKPLTTYYFRISAVINGSEGLQSGPVTATTIAPIDFRVTNTNTTGISLGWNTVNGAKYEIYRSDSGNTNTFSRIITNLTYNSYIDTGISPNRTYYYYIGITFNVGDNNYHTFGFGNRVVSATAED
jgi:fibronectin type 3 domain-containing protein